MQKEHCEAINRLVHNPYCRVQKTKWTFSFGDVSIVDRGDYRCTMRTEVDVPVRCWKTGRQYSMALLNFFLRQGRESFTNTEINYLTKN